MITSPLGNTVIPAGTSAGSTENVTSVGLTTITNGLYFTGSLTTQPTLGPDAADALNYQYSFESVFDEVLCNIIDVYLLRIYVPASK